MEPERDLIKKTKNILAWSRDEKSRRADLQYCRRPRTQVLRSALLTNELAARLNTLSALGELRHKEALNTPKFDSRKSAAREGGVSAEIFANLDARCEDYYTM